MWVLGSKMGLKGKKWTENGDKNTQSDFFQYMRTLKATKFTKWFVTLRYRFSNVDNLYFNCNWGYRGPQGSKRVQ